MVTPLRKTVRIPFSPVDSNRAEITAATDSDSIIKNGFVDIRTDIFSKEQVSYVVKRPGFDRVLSPTGFGSNDDYCQGFWFFGDYAFLIYADILYKVLVSAFNGDTNVGLTSVYQTIVSQVDNLSSSTVYLPEKFGDDFDADYRYNATEYIDTEYGECLYITNGIETIGIKSDGTYFLPREPANLYQANSYYLPGDRVIPSAYANQNIYEYILIGEAGTSVAETTEPTWPTSIGSTVVSAAGNTWVCVGRRTITYSYTNRAYSLGNFVIPSIETGYYYKVITAGTTTAEPTWTQLKGDTCDDSGVVFECMGNYARPGLMLPMPLYLDTFLVVNKYKTSDLYHSDPTDPNSWNPVNFISADSFTSYTRAIARYNNYIIAFGETDTELFYNNANTSGSTLSRHESFLLQIGANTQRSVVGAENIVAWLGNSAMGGRAIWMLDGFEPKEISTPWVNKILEKETTFGANSGSYSFRIAGHNFLVWVLETAQIALLFDIGLNLWYYWTQSDSVNQTTERPATPEMFVYNKVAIYNNEPYFASSRTQYIAKLDPSIYQDQTRYSPGYNPTIQFEIRTPKIDFGNRKRKFCHSLEIIGDPSDSDLHIVWSDDPDDFARFTDASSNPVTSSVSLLVRPRVAPMGSFRRRSYRFFHAENTALRLEGFDLTYTQGIS